ncbi:MAG: shikimate dehydrogenase [Sporolactobacillus sp.]
MSRHFLLIGMPVGHSLSPALHRFWFRQYKLDATYRAQQVAASELADFVDAVRKHGDIHGFNVTAPHKQAIVPLLDRLDHTAQLLDAVNTVCCEDGIFTGYNTDGEGFSDSLAPYISARERMCTNVLILGAGGAAAAVALTLAQKGYAAVDVANRTLARGQALSARCNRYCLSSAMPFSDVPRRLGKYRLVINATSSGLNSRSDMLFDDWSAAQPGTLFCDLVYRPRRTPFLAAAERFGFNVMDGLPMLVGQGAAAFACWMGGMQPDQPSALKYLESAIEMKSETKSESGCE